MPRGRIRQPRCATRRPSRRGTASAPPAWLAETLAQTRSTCCSGCRSASSSSRVVAAGWGTAIGSFITFIGIPVALLTIAATRGLANVERRRAQLVLGDPVPATTPRPCRCSATTGASCASSGSASADRVRPPDLEGPRLRAAQHPHRHDRLHDPRHRLEHRARADHRAGMVVVARQHRRDVDLGPFDLASWPAAGVAWCSGCCCCHCSRCSCTARRTSARR